MKTIICKIFGHTIPDIYGFIYDWVKAQKPDTYFFKCGRCNKIIKRTKGRYDVR